jgi:hypothetical protein
VGSIITSGSLVLAVALLGLGCSRLHVTPLPPPPYRAEVSAPYERTWPAIVRALARQNVPIRAIARDSGVIASDEFVSPINVYADCGQIGGEQVEGEALVSFTLYAEPNGPGSTRLQVNSKMRTQAHRRGTSGSLRAAPVLGCASTGRFEANLLDAVREGVRP